MHMAHPLLPEHAYSSHHDTTNWRRPFEGTALALWVQSA